MTMDIILSKINKADTLHSKLIHRARTEINPKRAAIQRKRLEIIDETLHLLHETRRQANI